jgi:hypothetical protein
MIRQCINGMLTGYKHETGMRFPKKNMSLIRAQIQIYNEKVYEPP